MNTKNKKDTVYDIFIIGGGINGCGIARDASGRGYSVYLCEADDLASGTSSQSTKLIHGGLRYLEQYEFRLVREALAEREILWQIAPHIIQPMRFILPHHKALRPSWLLRLGLFIYDHIGGRKRLGKSHSLSLENTPEGSCLKEGFSKGFEYSDCAVNDSRLVVLNAMDAAEYGATIETRHECTGIERATNYWQLSVKNTLDNSKKTIKAKLLINAAGPWVDGILNLYQPAKQAQNIRLVQGSHIVVPKLYGHQKCYIFQNADNRIIFAIPYHQHYTLIGTTDRDYDGDPRLVRITDEETQYLCDSANQYFKKQISASDVVRTYAGVRSLYNDGDGIAQEATRDYVLRVDQASDNHPALINVFGGKITTYRRLAESMLEHIENILGKVGSPWTKGVPLPGGDFSIDDKEHIKTLFKTDYHFLSDSEITRLLNSYGTRVSEILGNAQSTEDLGKHFGHGLYQCEVEYLINTEWARTADDILFRRSKLGLHFSDTEKSSLQKWLERFQKARK